MPTDKQFSTLLPFQAKAVDEVLTSLSTYDGRLNIYPKGKSIPEELWGKPKPYLHRIKAITGAGKTPMLAAIASKLGECIILWTTARKAVIDQTTESLEEKYKELLSTPGIDTHVISLDDLLSSNSEWDKVINSQHGRTIITTTVGAFNQSQDNAFLRIHKGHPTPWEQLAMTKRPLYVLYDEGHNATDAQFDRLEDLRPKALIMASASQLSSSLYRWIPGENDKDKESEVNDNRTTRVSTSDVVANGLLKKIIKIYDLETSNLDLLKEAVEKWRALSALTENKAIACYIVDRTADGLDVWKNLVALNVDASSIAVHLTKASSAAKAAIKAGESAFSSLRATYDEGLDPSSLRKHGYKHIIWNLSLEEGWDEPWAYIGYFYGEQTDPNKVVQRIGRLIRNPYKSENGQPAAPEEDELRTISCFLRSENKLLKEIVEQLKVEMDTGGLDVISVKSPDPKINVIVEECRTTELIPRLCINPDMIRIPQELKSTVFSASFSDEAKVGKGVKTIGSYEVGAEGLTGKPEEIPFGVPSTIADVVKGYLELKDARLIRSVGSTGGWISPSFWDDQKLREKIYIGSSAYQQYRQRCDSFIDNRLDLLIEIVEDADAYEVPPIRLINPDLGVGDRQKLYYKRHFFKNSIHASYNGLNEFELEIAHALDRTGLTWCRNPSKVGYGIPLPRPSGSSSSFYPDFLLWKSGTIYFIESKGSHLLNEALCGKMLSLPKNFKLGIISRKADDVYLYRMANNKVSETKGSTLIKAAGNTMLDTLLLDLIDH